MKKITAIVSSLILSASLLAGCGASSASGTCDRSTAMQYSPLSAFGFAAIASATAPAAPR